MMGQTIYGSRSSAVPAPGPGKNLLLVAATPSDACGDLFKVHGRLVKPDRPFVVIAERGGCTFAEKLVKARQAGAAALFIANNIASAYTDVNKSFALVQPCVVDCAEGSRRLNSSFDNPTAQRLSGFRPACVGMCASGDCAASGILETDHLSLGANIEICCLPDTLMVMNVTDPDQPDAGDSIPAVFFGRLDGRRLLEAARAGDSMVVAEDRERLKFEPSMLIIWFVGVFAMSIAAWLGSSKERADAAALLGSAGAPKEPPRAGAPSAEDEPEEPIEMLHLTASHALAFVLVASVSLVCMFVLLQMGMYWIIRVIQLLFCVGCVTALFQFAFYPMTYSLLSHCCGRRCASLGSGWSGTTLSDLIAVSMSMALVVWYYVCRHRPYAWALQDIMALSLCAMFMRTVRIQNLRVATVLLVVFFFYDIFMVFISPLLFRKSVMVEVATAGAAGQPHVLPGSDGRSCTRTQGERMPVLFMVPRFDFYGGFAMLGLGDVVMPGLLVCLALRYDYATRGLNVLFSRSLTAPRSARTVGYFVILVLGYAVGLLMALLANYFGLTINGVKGQPALLYLVPATLGVFMAVAACRGELRELWGAEDITDLAPPDASPTRRQDAWAQVDALPLPADDASPVWVTVNWQGRQGRQSMDTWADASDDPRRRPSEDDMRYHSRRLLP